MHTGDVAGRAAGQDVTSAVVSALAAAENVRADELTPPLYDVIDPEALENLFRNTSGRVTFEYDEYHVTVDDDHTVEIHEAK
jgi:hypothetical protein